MAIGKKRALVAFRLDAIEEGYICVTIEIADGRTVRRTLLLHDTIHIKGVVATAEDLLDATFDAQDAAARVLDQLKK